MVGGGQESTGETFSSLLISQKEDLGRIVEEALNGAVEWVLISRPIKNVERYTIIDYIAAQNRSVIFS